MGTDQSALKPLTPPSSTERTPITGSVWDSFSHKSSVLTNKLETEFYHTFNTQKSWQETMKYVQFLKTIRHPNVLKYMSDCVTGECITLRTSPTIPLALFSKQCSKAHLTQGIRDVATALKFIQTNTESCHLGLSVGEVFVDTFTGSWLLGGFALTRKLSSTTVNEMLALDQFSILREEISQNDLELETGASLDVWLFKQFVNDVIEASKYHYALENLLEWLDTSWTELSFDEILSHEELNNIVTESLDVLTRISLMDRQERLLFIESLPMRLPKLDESVLAFRIAPFFFSSPLSSERFVRDNVIPYLLVPKSKKFLKEVSINQRYIENALLSEDTFRLYMVPLILRLYARRELSLRIILLKFFKYYVYIFSYQQQTQLHQEILIGLRDSQEEIARLTFFALGELTSYLGVTGVTGRDVKVIFTDPQPRDYQLTSTNEQDETEKNDSSQTSPVSPAKICTPTTNHDQHDSVDPFFASELRENYSHDQQPVDTVRDDEKEAKLYSTITKPKLILKRTESFPEFEQLEPAVKVPIVEEESKTTLLELSRGISLRDSVKVKSGIEYEETDSSCSDFLLRGDLNGDEVAPTEQAWEDWDPFSD